MYLNILTQNLGNLQSFEIEHMVNRKLGKQTKKGTIPTPKGKEKQYRKVNVILVHYLTIYSYLYIFIIMEILNMM